MFSSSEAQNPPHFALSSPFWVLPVTGGSDAHWQPLGASRPADVRSATTPPGRGRTVLKIAGVTNSPQVDSNLINFPGRGDIRSVFAFSSLPASKSHLNPAPVGHYTEYVLAVCTRCPFQSNCPECPYVHPDERKTLPLRPCPGPLLPAPQTRSPQCLSAWLTTSDEASTALPANAAALELAHRFDEERLTANRTCGGGLL